jgi:hypothetical protein
MISNWRQAWPAQKPMADFTERTVAALVRQRRTRSSSAGRRWLGIGVTAAALVTGGAWGFVRVASRPARSTVVPPLVERSASSERPVEAPPVSAPTTEPPVAPPAPPAAHSRRGVASPASRNSPPARKVVLPRCHCSPNEAICDCF